MRNKCPSLPVLLTPQGTMVLRYIYWSTLHVFITYVEALYVRHIHEARLSSIYHLIVLKLNTITFKIKCSMVFITGQGASYRRSLLMFLFLLLPV